MKKFSLFSSVSIVLTFLFMSQMFCTKMSWQPFDIDIVSEDIKKITLPGWRISSILEKIDSLKNYAKYYLAERTPSLRYAGIGGVLASSAWLLKGGRLFGASVLGVGATCATYAASRQLCAPRTVAYYRFAISEYQNAWKLAKDFLAQKTEKDLETHILSDSKTMWPLVDALKIGRVLQKKYKNVLEYLKESENFYKILGYGQDLTKQRNMFMYFAQQCLSNINFMISFVLKHSLFEKQWKLYSDEQQKISHGQGSEIA